MFSCFNPIVTNLLWIPLMSTLLEWANLSDFFVLGRTKLSICLTKLCIRKKRLAKCCTQVLMMFLRRKAIKDLLYCQWPSIRAVFCNFLIIFLYIGFFCICIYVCLHFLIVYLFVGWTRQLLVAVPPCEVGWGLLGGNLFQKHLLLLFATIAHHLSKIKIKTGNLFQKHLQQTTTALRQLTIIFCYC